MTGISTAEIEKWDALELDDLLQVISRAASSGGAPMDPQESRKYGMTIVRGWFKTVRAHVCVGTAKDRDELFSYAADVAMVVDVGASPFFGGVPVSTLCVASFKYGVKMLCQETA